jgi:hypothetical protein
MSQPLVPGDRALAGPQFYVTPRHRFSAGPILLAVLIASGVLFAVLRVQSHYRAGAATGDDDDDPSQVDTIYLGDPGQAPVLKRPASQPSTVHPFVVIHLPRSGSQFGQIPDTPTGRLLYAWLAAFNGTDPSALGRALPSPEVDQVQAAQEELRRETGGFTLLSAKEVQPGVLVFRLHDQMTPGNEVLGTLQMRPDTNPAVIASFSLRAVPPPPAKAQ